MAEIWGTRGLSPANKSVFNYKVENFQRLLKICGKGGFDSPSFDVVGLDGKMHPLKLKIKHYSCYNCNEGYPVSGFYEGGERSMDEFVLFQVDITDIPAGLLLAGTFDVELDGKTILGSIGNAEKDQFERSNTIESFTNKSSTVTIRCNAGSIEVCNIFSVATTKDKLEIKVQLTTPGIMIGSTSLVPNDQSVQEVGMNRLLADFKFLLTSVDNYADFSIVCQGENFPCHEAILRARSPVFDKMFAQKLKEWTTREMIMDDVKKETVGLLLEYIYTSEVTKKVENDAELIYVADKYYIAGLMELCFRKLPEVEENKVVDILILADRHNLEDFKKLSMQRILKHKKKFLKDEDFVAKLKETPHILMDLFQL